MKRLILISIIGLLTLAACTPAQPPAVTGPGVETIVAATLQAMTAAPSPTSAPPSGLPVSYNNISFTIPLTLNASATASATTDVEYPYINPSGGPMAGHVVFGFTNFPISGEAKIMVFKASDYAAYGAVVQDAVTALLAGQDVAQPLPKALAFGFHAQAKPILFKNGHGVRYLTKVSTYFAPVTNTDIFYYYQGITNDGAYFVSAIFHVNASFLVADSKPDSSTPPDGVPFNWGPDLDFTTYISQVTQKLNETAPENFNPSLLVLDEMIGSLQVTAP